MAHLAFLLASDGKNAQLAQQVAMIAEGLGHSVDMISLTAFDFPLYTVRRDDDIGEVAGLSSLVNRLDDAQSWFVFAPEYNGSMPPVLNNAIAWLSRNETDFRRLFRDRIIGLATRSGGGGHHVILAMRTQFSYLGSNVIGRSIVTNKDKALNTETAEAMLRAMTRV